LVGRACELAHLGASGKRKSILNSFLKPISAVLCVEITILSSDTCHGDLSHMVFVIGVLL
jgi:hypothetical protein